jgi:hypothetical protein
MTVFARAGKRRGVGSSLFDGRGRKENVSGIAGGKRIFGGLKAYLRATDHTSSNIISREEIISRDNCFKYIGSKLDLSVVTTRVLC